MAGDGLHPSVELDREGRFEDAELGLERSLAAALGRIGCERPTLVQSRLLAVRRRADARKRDLLVTGHAGDGKSFAALLVLLDAVLLRGRRRKKPQLYLSPSREHCHYVARQIARLGAVSDAPFRTVNLSENVAKDVLRSQLRDEPEVLIATPSQIVPYLDGRLDPGLVVVDDADLAASFGHEADLRAVAARLPDKTTRLLVGSDPAGLQIWTALFLRDPVEVTVKDELAPVEYQITQYFTQCPEEDKFLLAYVTLKLQLLRGRCVLFVNDIDRSYRLSLFLTQFGLKNTVIDSEHPLQFRVKKLKEFDDKCSILIAVAEQELLPPESTPDTKGSAAATEHPPLLKPVNFIMNFDFPTTLASYLRRLRLVAGGKNHKLGTVLSFVIPKEHFGKSKTTSISCARQDPVVFARIEEHLGGADVIKKFDFDMAQIDKFRYRFADVLRSVTRTAVKHARMNEIRKELLSDERLQEYFETHPLDLAALKGSSANPRAKVRMQSHLKNVPEYLMPRNARKRMPKLGPVGWVPFSKPKENRIRKARAYHAKKKKSRIRKEERV